jgi:hypothetical protein
MNSYTTRTRTRLTARLALAFVLLAVDALAADGKKIAQRLPELGLSSFTEPIFTYYSDGAKAHAMRLATNIARMRDFYRRQLGIQTTIALAVLNSNDWSRLDASSVAPYGVPFNTWGLRPTGVMPAQGGMIFDGIIVMPVQGGVLFDGVIKGKKSFTPEQQAFLTERKTTYEALANIAVDDIGFHELGHILTFEYGIDPRCMWLLEFLATYFGEAFTANEQGDWTIAREFAKQPASSSPRKRPKHTTLTDYENHAGVGFDNLGWYMTQFHTQAQDVQSRLGVKFLKDVKRLFPADSENSAAESKPLTPEESLTRLEDISPGFKKWAEVFREDKPIEK